jgi:hypothetical protein
MIRLRKIFVIIPFFTLSCASQYLKSYEPINVYLETRKIDKSKQYILQKNKEYNKQALRLFISGEGAERIVDPTDPIDYTDGLYVEKHWKKVYHKYALDTLDRYWKKEDFPEYNFILEKGRTLIHNVDFLNKYGHHSPDQIIIISEPLYYWNRKYIMFYYTEMYPDGSGPAQVVIMKKVKEKWVVVREIGDYIYR